MTKRGLLIVVLAAGLACALALPAAAAPPHQQEYEQRDPMAGRIGFGFHFGGVSSNAGTGFEGGLDFTYYVNSYFSTTLGAGYGFYPVDYTGPNDETKTTQINYIPVTLALTVYPLPRSRISPYFGPGVGMTYSWWKQALSDGGDKKYDQTLWSVFAEGGLIIALGHGFTANVGLRYTLPDVSHIDFKDGYLTYSGGGGVTF
jgi:outer membrane protein W